MIESEPDRLNRWLTLGANLGVVLGLVILIVEVRQNADLTRAQMESGKNDLLAQIELSLATTDAGAAWIKSIRSPEDMTDLDIRMVESHLVALMLQWDHMFNMEEIGLVSRTEARQHILNTAQYYFGSRHARNWWKLQQPGWEGTPMMEVAGPIIDGLDENFMLRYLEESRVGASIEDRAFEAGTQNEAKRFMDSYAADLRNHDRAALVARYDRSHATMIFNGERIARSFDEIQARYRDQWIGPVSFDWRDLAFEVLGPDSMIVTGKFDWGTPDGIDRYSYSGVLQRQEGELRILLEVESMIPVVPEGSP